MFVCISDLVEHNVTCALCPVNNVFTEMWKISIIFLMNWSNMLGQYLRGKGLQ